MKIKLYLIPIFLIAILIGCACFVCTNQIAYADNTPIVYVGNVDVVNENVEGVSFDSATKTLTLNNYVNNSMNGYAIPGDDNFTGLAGIYLGQVSTINLVGKSSITLENGNNACVGVFSTHSITFGGNGELDITVGKTKQKANFGIYANNISFIDTAIVNIMVTVGEAGSEGIHSDGKVTISGARIVSNTGISATGLSANQLVLNSGSLFVDANKGTGISVGSLKISGGAINAKGSTVIEANNLDTGTATIINKDPEGIDWTQNDVKYPLGIGFPVKMNASDASCEEDGNIECYTIKELDRYFSDSACTVELDKEDVIIEAPGHSFGTISYIWNGTKCIAKRTCTKCEYVEQETADSVYSVVVEPKCVEEGVGQYKATFTNEDFVEQIQENPIPATGHTYETWVEEIDSTLEKEGTFGYQHCTVCNKNFDRNDKELTSLIKPKKVAKLENSNGLVFVSKDGGIDSFLTISAREIDVTDESIANVLKTSKKYNNEIYYALDISLLNEGVEIQPNGNIKVSIKIPDELKNKEFVLVHIYDNQISQLDFSILDNDVLWFETSHFSEFVFIEPPVETLPVWAVVLILVISLVVIAAMVLIIELTPRPVKEEEFKLEIKE